MPPMIILRDDPPVISSWAVASNQTSDIQAGDSTLKTSAVGFIVPLAIVIGILIILLGACWYHMIVLCRHQPVGRNPATPTTVRIKRAVVRAARKEEINREVESEPFSRWRAKQLEKMINQAAFPTQVVCIVCLNEFAEDDLVRDLHCTHVFHVDCLDEWYSRGHNQCPLCKSELCHSNNA